MRRMNEMKKLSTPFGIVRIEQPLYDRLRRLAKADRRSVQAFVNIALKDHVSQARESQDGAA
jgi:hypothetical protein